ncbi:MAG TPA: hypothetical protein DCY88_27690, partial [Cyanobacteria bacterium UBA11372]|nr:hypothetical protein [Cyanobacteria bacterium UBA11372]
VASLVIGNWIHWQSFIVAITHYPVINKGVALISQSPTHDFERETGFLCRLDITSNLSQSNSKTIYIKCKDLVSALGNSVSQISPVRDDRGVLTLNNCYREKLTMSNITHNKSFNVLLSNRWHHPQG